jgi:branched-chain amino acid aminotransferase
VKSAEGGFTIGGGKPGATTERIRSALVAIQRGQAPDPYGWIEEIA